MEPVSFNPENPDHAAKAQAALAASVSAFVIDQRVSPLGPVTLVHSPERLQQLSREEWAHTVAVFVITCDEFFASAGAAAEDDRYLLAKAYLAEMHKNRPDHVWLGNLMAKTTPAEKPEDLPGRG